MTNNELILVHEPGLGDHFICNGLVNWFSQHVDKLFLPTYDISIHNNLATVRALYANNTKVEIVPVPVFVYHWESRNTWDDYFGSWNTPVLQIYKPELANPFWYQYFYQQVGLDWNDHKRYATVPPASENAQELLQLVQHTYGADYKVVHNQSTAGTYEFQECGNSLLPTVNVTPGFSSSLLDWQLVLQNAQEIHACQSSVFWMCTVLDNLPNLLFYHDSRPTHHPIFPEHFPQWEFVTGYY